MNRREMITTTALGGAGFVVGTGFAAPACNTKSLSTYAQMVAGGFAEVKSLLPTLGLSQTIIAQIADLLDKGVKIAKDFDQAYKDGKFTDAATLFTNLGSIVSQVVSTLGISVENRSVKIALAAIGVARVAISILLQREVDAQVQVAGDVQAAKRRPGTPEAKAISEIERLAATDLSKLAALLP